jgi:hypothetical protein
MNASEESLFKLLLTADMDQQERSFAQYLGNLKPDALFYSNSGLSSPTKAKPGKSAIHAHPLIRYQFKADDERIFNCDLAFFSLSSRLAIQVLRAGEVGGSRVNYVNGKSYYHTSRFERDCDLESSAWQLVLQDMADHIVNLEAKLPSDIDSTLAKRELDREQIAATRERRELKKDLMKVGVFHKFKVRSTPETELLFKVCSRMGTEQSVCKAFGDLLPLITGGVDDAQ